MVKKIVPPQAGSAPSGVFSNPPANPSVVADPFSPSGALLQLRPPLPMMRADDAPLLRCLESLYASLNSNLSALFAQMPPTAGVPPYQGLPIPHAPSHSGWGMPLGSAPVDASPELGGLSMPPHPDTGRNGRVGGDALCHPTALISGQHGEPALVRSSDMVMTSTLYHQWQASRSARPCSLAMRESA